MSTVKVNISHRPSQQLIVCSKSQLLYFTCGSIQYLFCKHKATDLYRKRQPTNNWIKTIIPISLPFQAHFFLDSTGMFKLDIDQYGDYL